MTSKLTSLRSAKTVYDLASLLGFSPSSITFILYNLPPATKYKTFSIAKRSGGTRLISAPEPRLKSLQRRLADLLQECRDEINALPENKKSRSHGFERQRSILTNANIHKRKRYVFNIDLENFFPSFNFGRVRGFFIKNKKFQLEPKIATLIAQIAIHNNELPQGSPCSPVISNLVADALDRRLDRLARQNRCRYSRYADDITFSARVRDFPADIAVPTGANFDPSAVLQSIIASSGFAINPNKTRMQYSMSRQIVTGLVVNEKPNIRKEYRRTLRAQVDSYAKTGSFTYVDSSGTPIPGRARQLEGKISHACAVKMHNAGPLNDSMRVGEIFKIARKFWLSHLFARRLKPVILCEGKTDNAYLRAALKSLALQYPSMVDSSARNATFKVEFVNLNSLAAEVIGLGGTANLCKLIHNYDKEVLKFSRSRPLHPLIIVVDNDSGAKGVFGKIKEATGKTVDINTKEHFYRIKDNMYVVKVPEGRLNEERAIEHLFDPPVLNTPLHGKIFHPGDKNFDPTKHYGKEAFAQNVVRPQANTLNFRGFVPLLDRIEEVLKDY
ncbi:retron Ec67 family RNA-directed DNA polymerase/endonuclease [Salinarimonas rosea]|uniref:retron Ec67 family RNA-directed DNA polymerase/endonuclease n=1 Tax=Salinarimonas rosea TaxID=552063 RepID=UPI00146FA32D|nr:retron Ec67 family RNA-directed DNA polymerase/endonuclease [Salinarimonas rosea]